MTKIDKEQITLSIETDAGTYQHGFHLGTDLALAKQIAEEKWHKLVQKQGNYVKTVALKRDGKVIGTFDGEW